MELKIEYIKIDELTAYDKNARKHENYDVEQIAKSIEKYGFNDPIGIWSDKNIIVEGHGRVLASKKLGLKEVPCIRLDHLTNEERREYAIMHNKTAELSSWDFDILGEELQDLDFGDFDVDFGLDFEEQDDDEEERKDVELKETISVVIDCENEIEAETIFEKLTEEGYKCRVSTL